MAKTAPPVGKGAQPKRKKSASREAFEWVLCIGTAVAAALAIKAFLVDIYSIPTGSMEPLLHGVEHGGDRVLCTKQSFRFRDPQGPKRWEVFVFTYPSNTPGALHYNENFIKRCVGLPGEVVYLRDGDLFVRAPGGYEPERVRKPAGLQQTLWIPVYEEDFTACTEESFAYHWASESPGWMIGAGRLEGAAAEGAARLRYLPRVPNDFESRIVDRHVKRQAATFVCDRCGGSIRKTVASQKLTAFCPRCGAFLTERNLQNVRDEATGVMTWNFPKPGLPHVKDREGDGRNNLFHAVKDLRLTCSVTPRSEAGALELSLVADDEHWRARFVFGTPGRVELERDGKPVEGASAAADLASGMQKQLAFERCDGVLAIEVDGRRLVEHALADRMPVYSDEETRTCGAFLTLRGGAAAIGRLGLYRDIQYFFLPPSTPAQSDNIASKQWNGENATRMQRDGCYIVPRNGYLAFGDNQPTSLDSRYWGPVPEENLIGPALLIWWPLHRIRILE